MRLRGVKQRLTRPETVWTAVGAASAMVAGRAARHGAQVVWRKWRREDPPANPASPQVSWSDALAWTFAVSFAAALSRVVARRSAAAAWKAATGREPPGF